MDTSRAPNRNPRKPGTRGPGAPRGNQNGRKHGRYSKLKPAERYAALEKVLRSYGLQDPYQFGALTIDKIIDDPNTNMRLLFFLLQTTIELLQIKESLHRR